MTPWKLKQLRKNLGWSGEQLSTYLGISLAAIYQWEKGRSRPRVNMLTRLYVLAQALKKSSSAGDKLGKLLESGTGNEARQRALAMLDRSYAAPAPKAAPKKKRATAKKAAQRRA